MGCLTPFMPQTARIFDADGCFHSLFANDGKAGMARDGVLTIRKKNKRASRQVTEDCRGELGKGCELTDSDKPRQ